MEHTLGEKSVLQDFFRWISSALGTFLFVFFMMHSIAIHTSGLFNGRWLVPYFSYPAYVLCVTIAADYWIGENLVRLRSYCVSTFVVIAMLFCGGAYCIPNYVHFAKERSVFAISLSVGIILYSIWYMRRKKTSGRQPTIVKEAERAQSNIRRVRGIRIVCLLCICCVLFESVQSSIMIVYGFITNVNLSRGFVTFTSYPLSIISAILLARFVKAEFVPRSAPTD